VTPKTTNDFDSLAETVNEKGYLMVEGVLSEVKLKELRKAYDAQLLRLLEEPARASDDRHPEGWFEIARIFERDVTFEFLMDLPLALELAVRVIGPDVELASTGELDHKLPGQSSSFCGWHTDFIWISHLPYPRQVFWLACYYLLDNLDGDMGPLTVLPGSHRFDHPPGKELNDAEGRGTMLEGAIPLTGCAGTGLFFNNEIWHMSPPNLSSRPRRIIKVHYKPSWMKQWGGRRQPTDEYAKRQLSPARRQLLGAYGYDDVPWQYGQDVKSSRYPVMNFLTAHRNPQ
jgi:ectoine hydroxylase-related dioxygenase (phytanoyl-CoA dioxygenase family)